jgi:hypothetical protein
MLTIGKDQMALLGASMREEYVASTLKDLAKLFPDEPAIKDEVATRALIEFGIERAEEYGITRGREVTLFIFLVQNFGRDFEKQPQNVWIQELLVDPQLEEPEKMDLIYTRLQLAGKPPGSEGEPIRV